MRASSIQSSPHFITKRSERSGKMQSIISYLFSNLCQSLGINLHSERIMFRCILTSIVLKYTTSFFGSIASIADCPETLRT